MNQISKFCLLLSILLILASCAEIKPIPQVEFLFDRNQVLPPVACLYRTQMTTSEPKKGGQQNHDHPNHSSASEWYLWRDGNRVEIQSLASTEGEVWERLKSGDVTFIWLYHDKKFAIHYAPSDLKAVGNFPDWTTKASIISPNLLKRLKKTGQSKAFGFNAQKYTGRIGEYDLEILWLPDLAVPAQIQQSADGKRTIVQLAQVYPLKNAPWQPIDSDDYEDMDFADIGDNEAHPLARMHMHGRSLTHSSHSH